MALFEGTLNSGAWFQDIIGSAQHMADVGILRFEQSGLSWRTLCSANITAMQVCVKRKAWTAFKLRQSCAFGVSFATLWTFIGITRPGRHGRLEMRINDDGSKMRLRVRDGRRTTTLHLRALQLTESEIPDLSAWHYETEVVVRGKQLYDMLRNVKVSESTEVYLSTRKSATQDWSLTARGAKDAKFMVETQITAQNRTGSECADGACAFNTANVLLCAKEYGLSSAVRVALQENMPLRLTWDLSDDCLFTCTIAPLMST